MCAGGTIAAEPATVARRLWLACELGLVFVAAPLAMREAVNGAHIPLFVALLPVLALSLILLGSDPAFRLRREFARGFGWVTAATILAVFVLGGGAVAYWMSVNKPHWFLEFPKNRPDIYWKIMILYPLASVAAQELVYRTFYFHRYGPLFGSALWLGVVVNAVLFGFCHIVVGSEVAVISTALGGLVLATRYALTRSYWAVFIEHTIWGWLVFTVGLGRFFFTGVSNV